MDLVLQTNKRAVFQKTVFAILLSGMVLLSLYDFYFPSIALPIVPILGTLCFLTGTLLMPRPRFTTRLGTHYKTILISLGIIVLFFASAFWGAGYYGSVNVKASIGLSMGVLVFTTMTLWEESEEYKRTLFRALNIILGIHVAFWLFQVLWSFTHAGAFIDYIQPFTGVPSRHLYGLNSILVIDRFTGLFAEPAIYSNFIFMGVTGRMVRNNYRLHRFDWLMIVTILLSLSVFGFFEVGVLMAVYTTKTGTFWKAFGIVSLLVVGLGIFIFTSDSDAARFLQIRMSAPLDDYSGNVRLTNPFTVFAELPEPAQVFGAGLGYHVPDPSFQEGNGIAFLLIYTGVLGAPLLVGGFLWLVGQHGLPRIAWCFVAAVALSAPPFTNQYWWLWIAMLSLFKAEEGAREPAQSIERLAGPAA